MERRAFIRTAALGCISYSMLSLHHAKTSHILTLSFDDGFKRSFYQIADIFESYGLNACLNIIASGHLPSFEQVGDYILPELMGSFDDWNELKSRGHEVMPHSWKHLNLPQQPMAEAKELITKCLDYFNTHLEGYSEKEAIFNFPFNASNEELEQFALQRVRGVRTSGLSAINPVTSLQNIGRLACHSKGPTNIDDWVALQVEEFIAGEGGWLILNLHGLDGEGWGPISASFLNALLGKLVKKDFIEILPAGEVLSRAS